GRAVGGAGGLRPVLRAGQVAARRQGRAGLFRIGGVRTVRLALSDAVHVEAVEARRQVSRVDSDEGAAVRLGELDRAALLALGVDEIGGREGLALGALVVGAAGRCVAGRRRLGRGGDIAVGGRGVLARAARGGQERGGGQRHEGRRPPGTAGGGRDLCGHG